MVSWEIPLSYENQEAKRVRDIGSLIFETPIQHDYEAGVEVRSVLSTERLEEIDGRLAVTDEDSHAHGVRYVKFWVDDARAARQRVGAPLVRKHLVVRHPIM